MRVLIISTAEKAGGGAIAANRLMTALNKNGVQCKMLVRDKETDCLTVASYGNKLPKIVERLKIILRLLLPLRRTWKYDTATEGIDILSTQEYKEANVIHLHWINQGMLSLRQLRAMMFSGKRIVWTLHDEWAFSGIKHYNGEFDRDEVEKTARFKKLDKKIYDEKRDIYKQGVIHFVGCSQWITELARKAMPGQDVKHINNCIPTDIFHPMNQEEVRRKLNLPLDKKLILFCSQNVNDERKGMRYLEEALEIGSSGSSGSNGSSGSSGSSGSIEVIKLGKGGRYISDPHEMAMMYAAVDCFVTPSLQDNLPNTIAEAMSCGTPCVGFNTGGIPEMIHHLKDGYVAEYRNSKDLAQGITYVLSHPELRKEALHSAQHEYSETHVAQEYIKIYEDRK